MIKSITISILMLILPLSVFAQSDNYNGFSAGINYGGAVPTEMDTADYGAGLPGAVAGLEYRITLNSHFSLFPSLLYDFRRFKYGTVQKNDTVVEVDITNNGNYVDVPTYYTVDVEGKSVMHQLDIRLPFHWHINTWSSIHLGVYGSWIMAGKDETTATVQIGEGSIIDDIVEESNAFDDINRYETGIILGGSFHINKDMLISIEGIRSLTPYYKKGYYAELNEGKEVKFYQTYGMIRLSYFY